MTEGAVMINKNLAEEILLSAMKTGADFAEIFAENTRSNNITIVDGKIDAISDTVLCGVGIRAFLGTKTAYASTTDISREDF